MNDSELLRKKALYQAGEAAIPELTLSSCEQAFEIEYTHNSTAIEGNTLTLIETKLVLEDGISVGGVYRSVDVYISGAQHTPSSPNDMHKQIEDFYADLTRNLVNWFLERREIFTAGGTYVNI